MHKNIFVTEGTSLLGSHFILHQLMNTDALIYCLVPENEAESPLECLTSTLRKAFSAVHEMGSEAGHLDRQINQRLFAVERNRWLENPGTGESALESVAIDELWHITAGDGSSAGDPISIRHLLAFIKNKKIPVINYVDSAYADRNRMGVVQAGRFNSLCAADNGDEEQAWLAEREIMNGGQNADLKFRIFKPSLVVGPSATFHIDQASGFYDFYVCLLDFKAYVEARIPEYFRFNRLNILLNPEARLNLICVDHVVRIISQIAERTETLNSLFHIANPTAISICSHLKEISPALDMEIKCCEDARPLNPVDELFQAHAETLIRDLAAAPTADCHQASEFDDMAADELRIDSQEQRLMAQKFVDSYKEQKKSLAHKVRAAIASLERKKLKLDDNQELNYYVGGTGDQTITIINAYGQSIYYWELLVAKLLEKYRVILWLARGSSPQSNVGEYCPMSNHVDDLKRILENENIEGSALLGWCTGSKLALQFFSKYPDAVSRLIFMGGAFKNLKGMESFYTKYEQNLEPLLDMVHKKPQLAASLVTYLKGVILGKTTDIKSVDVNAPESREQILEMLSAVNINLQPFVIEPFTDPSRLVQYAKQLADFWGHNVAGLLETVNLPVLFMSGELDAIASAAISKEAAKSTPGAKYLEVKGGTHYLQFENAELVSAIIERFLIDGWNFKFEHHLISSGA